VSRTATVPVTGGALVFEESGEGRPVILLHAAIGDSRGWNLVAPLLARDYRVIRYDARGFGRSSRPDTPFSLAGDLGELMDRLELPSAALVGNSMGATTALDFALAHPERVESLVLIAPGLSGFPRDDSPVEDKIGAAVEAGDLARAAELDRRYWAPLDSGPETEELIDRMVAENSGIYDLSNDLLIEPPDATVRLPDLSVDTLIVLGAADVDDVSRIGAFIEKNAPRARSVTLDGADHLVPLRVPGPLYQLIHAHLGLPGA
jgi:pimeloyl-ACP methyl ester carboxylesterase